MKEAVTKVINTLTQDDFDGAFQKLLERYNKCIAAGGDYFKMSNSSILPIDMTQSGATTPAQSGLGSDGNEGVLCIPQIFTIT